MKTRQKRKNTALTSLIFAIVIAIPCAMSQTAHQRPSTQPALPMEKIYKTIDLLIPYMQSGDSLSLRSFSSQAGLKNVVRSISTTSNMAVKITFSGPDLDRTMSTNKILVDGKQNRSNDVMIASFYLLENACVDAQAINHRYHLQRAFPPESGPGAAHAVYGVNFAHGTIEVEAILPSDGSPPKCATSILLSFLDPPKDVLLKQ